MFRHIALFKWKTEATAEQRADAVTRLRELPALVSEIRSASVAENVGDHEGNYDVAFIVDFDDKASFERYLVNPDHHVVRTANGLLLDGRASLQVES